MKRTHLKILSLLIAQFILSCSVVTATTQDTPQTVEYGGTGSVARAATGNLLLPENTVPSKPVVGETPLYKKTNFPEMRRGLEKLFDSYVTGTVEVAHSTLVKGLNMVLP